MNIIPIAFAFDNNLAMPACVCISSLMLNAKEDTFYDIFILHAKNESLNTEQLDKLPLYYKNCSITYRSVGNTFDGAFEIRGVTKPTYFRLLIPQLIPEYDKVIYADVDIIFRLDLWNVYNTDIGDNYIAATYDLGMNLGEDGQKYIKSMPELAIGEYIQAGFVIFNSKAILENGIIDKFLEQSKRKLKYQDQDILNIVCAEKKYILSSVYNMTDYSFFYLVNKTELLTEQYAMSYDRAIYSSNLHYNGHKPWKKYSTNFDIWWEYYRKSPFFDEKFYFNFFYKRIDEYDRLPLWKRIKILVRFFIFGKKK